MIIAIESNIDIDSADTEVLSIDLQLGNTRRRLRNSRQPASRTRILGSINNSNIINTRRRTRDNKRAVFIAIYTQLDKNAAFYTTIIKSTTY